MLEEAVVGEADEERRFAARGVAEEDLFLDLPGCSRGSAFVVVQLGGKRLGIAPAVLSLSSEPAEPCLERDKRRGRKASTVDRV